MQGEEDGLRGDTDGNGEFRWNGELGVCAGVEGREGCFMAERRGGPGMGMCCGQSDDEVIVNIYVADCKLVSERV